MCSISFRVLCPRFAFYHFFGHLVLFLGRFSYLVSHISYHVLSHAALNKALATEATACDVHDMSQAVRVKSPLRNPMGSTHTFFKKPQAKNFNSKTKDDKCYRCGRKHDPEACWYKDATCDQCGKKGHIKPVCRSKSATAASAKASKASTSRVDKNQSRRPGGPHSKAHVLTQENDESEECYTMYALSRGSGSLSETFLVENKTLEL